VLVGITPGDNKDVVDHMVSKTLNMRLWENNEGKAWTSSVMDIGGEVLAVSQFTLYGILKGNKPDFHGAMPAEQAKDLFDLYVDSLKKKYSPEKIQTGKFQALMEVGSIINGPVTIQYEKIAE
jgi:D-aminoacyl-tRNA deacylase